MAQPFPLRLRLRGKVQGAHPCAPVRAATGSARPSPPRLWVPALAHEASCLVGQSRTSLCATPSGRSPKALRGSGAPFGVLKTPPRAGWRWVAPIPVGASRAPSEAGSLRETFDRARGALFSARRVRRAPGRSEAHRGPRDVCAMFARRSDRAAFSFVHFFWPNKRNGLRVQGRSHPQLAV
jgi:hypothetical protein